MKSVPVFAVADSRLHADVMLIRLRRADIPCDEISAFFPRRSVPNAVACWLRLHDRLSLKVAGETFSAAGKIPSALKPLLMAGTEAGPLLETAGLDRVSAHRLESKLDQGHILLAVSARDEDEASVAWHVFKHAGADTIVVGAAAVGECAHEPSLATSSAWETAA